MPYTKITKHQQEKVLKTILSFKRPYKNSFAATSSFYSACGFSLDVVESCLNALAAQEMIDVILSRPGSYPTTVITQKAFNYFPDKNDKSFKYWFPIICSNVISVIALIVAILAYTKQ